MARRSRPALALALALAALFVSARAQCINTVAGGGGGAGPPAFSTAMAITRDGTGAIVWATENGAVYRLTADGVALMRVAGNPSVVSSSGDGGVALAATFGSIYDITRMPDGSLLVSDLGSSRVRRLAMDGNVYNFAGNGIFAFAGDGGPATAASFNNPLGLTAAADGTVYIVDSNNFRVRAVSPSGNVTTVAGTGVAGNGGDGGPAKSATLYSPRYLALSSDGLLAIGQSDGKFRVVKLATGIISWVFDGFLAAGSGLYGIRGMAFRSDGALVFIDNLNYIVTRSAHIINTLQTPSLSRVKKPK